MANLSAWSWNSLCVALKFGDLTTTSPKLSSLLTCSVNVSSPQILCFSSTFFPIDYTLPCPFWDFFYLTLQSIVVPKFQFCIICGRSRSAFVLKLKLNNLTNIIVVLIDSIRTCIIIGIMDIKSPAPSHLAMLGHVTQFELWFVKQSNLYE